MILEEQEILNEQVKDVISKALFSMEKSLHEIIDNQPNACRGAPGPQALQIISDWFNQCKEMGVFQ